ncbi:pyrrolo-quinoline quinone [Paracidobacterium acidisoli]|nr:pyrrolo-quinoline quinone [Paracidobacterium acidisoli]MBT9330724.1 pyrrolo-quinoline quinone [Paracidobacterium acidisoli]
MKRTALRNSGWCWGVAVLAAGLCAQAQMTTSQYDNARTGAYLHERTLTPQNVNAQQFGKLFTLRVDGDVYAQPLFLSGVEVPGKGRHDVLFVVTEHDSVYAFDAYGRPAAPLWHVSFLKDGATPVPAMDVQCPFIRPEVGVTSTPVIDAKTGTLYVLARTKDGQGSGSEYHQRLHALAVTTGAEKSGGPVEIRASVQGTGDGSARGRVKFEPLRENPRAALLLVNGMVYLTWASSCDVGPYHGWVMAYDAQSLKQRAVFNDSPNADDGGIWASDTGPAADGAGNLFVATGNGRFDAAKGGHDYGDSLLRMSLTGAGLRAVDYFTPFNVDELDKTDRDLGSGGPLLLPDQPGAHPHVALVGGKGPMIYVVDRDRMGQFHAGDNSHAVQTIATVGGIFGSMAYWNHHVYVLSDGDALRDYEVKDGRLTFRAASNFRFPVDAATPTVSANGDKDGIVWVMSSKAWDATAGTPVLHAVDALHVTHELYNSAQNAARDEAGAGTALRFNLPMVMNGHVYAGAKGEVDVYGLLSTKH